METDTTQQAFDFGVSLAASFHGLTAGEWEITKAASETLSDPTKPGYGVVQRRIAKMAANMYEEVDQVGSLEFHLYDTLSKRANWHPVYDKLLTPVYGALQKVATTTFQKKSAVGRNKLFQVLARTGMAAPDVAKLLIGAGALTGGAMGAGAWYINRDIEEDQDKLEAMKARRDLYRRLTKEISDTLAEKRGPLDNDMSAVIRNATGVTPEME